MAFLRRSKHVALSVNVDFGMTFAPNFTLAVVMPLKYDNYTLKIET